MIAASRPARRSLRDRADGRTDRKTASEEPAVAHAAADVAAARAVHARMLPLMSVNFIESNPGPVKAAMAAMGLLEEVYRLPMVSPSAASKAKIVAVLKALGLLKAVLV